MPLANSISLSSPAFVARTTSGVSYVRTAFISSAGNDGTAQLNNPALPYVTLDAAIIALDNAHPGLAVTVRVVDNITESVILRDCLVSGGSLTFVGHEGLRTIAGTIDGTVPAAGPGQDGDPPTPGGQGGDGFSITLDAITLDTFTGDGGYGGTGGSSTSGGDQDGAAGGDGGDGGNATLLNGADVTNFNSGAGGGGTGGAGAGTGATGATGSNGNAGSEL